MVIVLLIFIMVLMLVICNGNNYSNVSGNKVIMKIPLTVELLVHISLLVMLVIIV